jgi:hypothetical protein
MSVNPPEGTLTIENSHLDVKGNVSAVALKLGTLRLTPSYGLDAVANVSNSTTHTLELSNAATGLVTTANVDVGGELAVTGNATVSSNLTVGGELTVTGNATVSSNLTVSGNVSLTGTGSLTVPTGTTAQRPATSLTGMVRFNTTTNKLEFYNGVLWIGVGGISATGGTTTESGAYRIHTFTTSGTFTVISGGEVEYLVVAGGGSGGGNVGGGGGAGGLLTGTVASLAVGSYTITVGAGGASAPSAVVGNDGNDSSFGTLIDATGGGGGGKGDGAGRNGGSGGGAGASSVTAAGPGSGTAGQGNNGGTGTSNAGTYSAGGGGGASTVGGNGVQGGAAGSGGTGLSSSITGTFTDYAGGGGGATYDRTALAPGGSGGGGRGGRQTPGVAATAGTTNTGGGGGGGGGTSGAGGDGIVIIRYLL